jgi:hypothetical protein
MRDGRIVRSLALIATASLVLGAFVAGPADAKKKKKKKPKVATCAPYTPGELGADAPITIVTDAATEEAPVEITVATAEGLGGTSPEVGGDLGPTSHAFSNVQVASSGRGLYARVEFTPAFDYDHFLRTSDGATVAYSAGFNQAMVAGDPTGMTGLDGTGNGGHSEPGVEQIDGYATNDCDGFTHDIASAGTPGEEVTVKYWLGDPAG